jgi:hypothetical protein
MYQQLLVLREGLYQTLDAACATATGGVTEPVKAASASAPVDDSAAAAEIKKLKEENAKLNYRVKILCGSLDE